MVVTTNIEIPILEDKKLVNYLESHEDDIAIGINDFGDLKDVDTDILKREPKEDT